MMENWKSFIELTSAKASSHNKVAQHWDTIDTVLNLIMIILAAATTIISLLPSDKYVKAGVSAATTLLSAVCGFLKPGKNRQAHAESGKAFRTLELKMVRAENEKEYEVLWKEYNKELVSEPFLPSKYAVSSDVNFSMSPELMILANEKRKLLKEQEHMMHVSTEEIEMDGRGNVMASSEESAEKTRTDGKYGTFKNPDEKS